MKHALLAAVAAVIFVATIGAASADRIELQWWHAMTAANAEAVNKIAADFNASQSEYQLVPVFKGSYAETMNAGIAAFRAGKAPDIIQIFEVGTATMMAAKGAVKPVYQLMKEAGEPFDPNAYLPAVTGYYSTADGRMLSLPFNSSTAIAYWNKALFKKAGLDPEKPPRTWPETFAMAEKLRAAGVPCGFTAGWISWTQLEQFSAWHNLPFASKADGFGGADARLEFNNPTVVRHIANLAAAEKDRSFDYGGRTTEPEGKFSQRRLRDDPDLVRRLRDLQIRRQIRFRDDRAALLPRCQRRAAEFDHRRRQPVGDGRQEARGIQGRRQILHLSVADRPAARLHEKTGYLPITKAAYEATRASGFYARNPGARNPGIADDGEAADRELARACGSAIWRRSATSSPRISKRSLPARQSAQAGLDDAVARGNAKLQQFEQNTR